MEEMEVDRRMRIGHASRLKRCKAVHLQARYGEVDMDGKMVRRCSAYDFRTVINKKITSKADANSSSVFDRCLYFKR